MPKSHQRASGRWWTKSLNQKSRFHYISCSGTAYVSCSGTAYATLPLAKCGEIPEKDE